MFQWMLGIDEFEWPDVQNFPGWTRQLIVSLKTHNYFSQPEIDKIMQTADCLSDSEPVFCGILILNEFQRPSCKGDYSF